VAIDPTTERTRIVRDNSEDVRLRRAATEFFEASVRGKYSYLFDWCGRPIIQYPQDIVALQEIVWTAKPDLIIETGIAHGGSLILSSTLLSLLDIADSQDPRKSKRKVIGVDIDIRPHNRQAIEDHPFNFKVEMHEGSSLDRKLIAKLRDVAADYDRVMVILDSNHTHDHVLEELQQYSPFVTPGQYCVVFDTVIEDLPTDLYTDRPWSKGDNPKTAIDEFMSTSSDFVIDSFIHEKLQLTVAPNGYLRRK
jgi:cephalosporin hydroxylase